MSRTKREAERQLTDRDPDDDGADDDDAGEFNRASEDILATRYYDKIVYYQ